MEGARGRGDRGRRPPHRLAPAGDREGEQRRDGEGQDPPRLHGGRQRARGAAADGTPPVVADQKVPQEERKRPHAVAGLLSAAASPSESPTTNASTAGSEASPPGQFAPAP